MLVVFRFLKNCHVREENHYCVLFRENLTMGGGFGRFPEEFGHLITTHYDYPDTKARVTDSLLSLREHLG